MHIFYIVAGTRVIPSTTELYTIPNLQPYTEYKVTVVAIGNVDTKNKTMTTMTQEAGKISVFA